VEASAENTGLTSSEEQELLKEFLAESNDNLARLDTDLVQLEQEPGNHELLGAIFRAVHTLKGSCGFFGYARLQAVAHKAEHLLSELRDGKRALTSGLSALLLRSADAMKRMIDAIGRGKGEGDVFERSLLQQLDAALEHVEERHAAPVLESPREPSANESAGTPNSLRVEVSVLDRLLDLVGELVITKNQLHQYRDGSTGTDTQLESIVQRLAVITSDLQDGVMRTRMQSVGTLWSKLPRVLRDLSVNLGKKFTLETNGAETELDRTIIETIRDPLIHIIRNACDHGIEAPDVRSARQKPAAGRISLNAFHEAGQVTIEISDDGAGIDPSIVLAKAVERGLLTEWAAQQLSEREIVNLVLMPGFSTAKEVTNLSGRGVGMDVVKTNVERVGGSVELVSRPQSGTTVRLRVPLTLAIVPGLIVTAGKHLLAIPQANLQEVVKCEAEQARTALETIQGNLFHRWRGELIPVGDLSTVLQVPPARSRTLNLVILIAEGRRFGLIVDRIRGTQEIVVKPLAAHLSGLNEYSGATIMGDGKLALILDVTTIASRLGVASGTDYRDGTAEEKAEDSAEHAVLTFAAGSAVRLALPLPSVERVEDVSMKDIQQVTGRALLDRNNHLLPVIDVAKLLGTESAADDVRKVIVCQEGEQVVGLLVDQVFGVSQCDPAHLFQSPHRFVRGTVRAGETVADVLRLEELVSNSNRQGAA